MVVKEKRGRKRYILFEHINEIKMNDVRTFLKQNSELINGKIRWRIISFETDKSIILIDHTKSNITRKLIEKNIGKLGIKPVKTSGTLKSLQK